MKLFVKSVCKEIPIALNIAFILSIAVVVLMKFWWTYVPELFKGGYEIGQIMENVFMSIITGYIFYFIVDFIPKSKERKKIARLLSRNLEDIYLPYFIIIKTLNQSTELNLYKNLRNEEVLRKAFRMISTDPPKVKVEKFGNNWIEFFGRSIHTSKLRTEKLYLDYKYLDIDLLQLIKDFEKSEFTELMKLVYDSGETNMDFSEYEDDFILFMSNLFNLKDYHDSNFRFAK